MPRGGSIAGTGTLGFGEADGSKDGFVCADEEKITRLKGPEIRLATEKCVFCIDKNNQVCNALRNSGLTTVKPATTMKKIALLTACSAALAAALNAQTPTTVTTDPVGFVSVTVPANSDAVLAVPLNRTSEYKGTVASISGNVVTVSGTPGWTASQFVYNGTTQLKTYAMQMASGTKEGLVAKITANTTSTITVQFTGSDDLVGVVAGDQIDIMPYWTPGSLVSATLPVGTELIGFVDAGAGVNLGASEVYLHTGSNVWEDEVNGGSATNIPLPFGASIILRNSSAGALSLSFVGSVPMNKFRIRLGTLAAGVEQDIAFGYMSPVPEALSTVGNPAVPVGQQSANALGLPVQAGDTIIGFDNSEVGINKGAAEVYQWTGTAFEDQVNGGNVAYTVTLKPGFGYIFRKAATASAQSVVWTHLQSYLN